MAPIQFHRSDVTPRPDGTIAMSFTSWGTEVEPMAPLVVIGSPQALAELRDQISAVLAHLRPPA